MAHLYHVAMIHCAHGQHVYKDALVLRDGLVQFGGSDFDELHEYLRTEFFADSDHTPACSPCRRSRWNGNVRDDLLNNRRKEVK